MKVKAALVLSLCLVVSACSPTRDEPGTDEASTSGVDEESEAGPGGSESESGNSESESGSSESETGESESETGEPEGNLLLSDKRLNIAHRGGGRLRPEATLPAFENALAVGADVIEFDLHGRIFLLHRRRHGDQLRCLLRLLFVGDDRQQQ